ncbi:glycosyltransferase family 4 protein [Geminocystis sp. NIES-3709]|uniref:glycosyltransferase family 4 protein n=1 Tax=Geminocystis sp. NIES-3709 TaxID=1617448 RepID=UPI0005FC86C8|nr:glycosyltransferase family 4 protein [Geminocystis sp. NIES-3709]BAQ66447.1 glycosyltransferase [Geminocystis sp. NIES-3709]
MKSKLKIAIVVHGRFYAFDLARELIQQGHDITLFTNYPKNIVEKFGIPPQYVKTFLLHGILTRIFHKLTQVLPIDSFDFFFSPLFSRWATKIIIKENYDAIHCFSGIAEELFKAIPDTTIKFLVRGSSHIKVQKQLLVEEEIRANKLLNQSIEIDQPNDWIIQREEIEYQLADRILVLSSFAYKSFIEQGFPPHKLKILPLGAQLSVFRPDIEIIEARCQRILSGKPLKVLMVGTFSLRKGVIDFVKIAKNASSNFQFQFVGGITSDGYCLFQQNNKYIDFIDRQPESELKEFYHNADIFIFTTIEDGYAVVLSQAQAGGLPILATTNCCAPDIIVENETGWILPIHNSSAFVEKLQWCHGHRQELSEMVTKVYQNFQPRDWSDVAVDFSKTIENYLTQK